MHITRTTDAGTGQNQPVLDRQENGLRLDEPVLCRQEESLGRLDDVVDPFVPAPVHSAEAGDRCVAFGHRKDQVLVESVAFLARKHHDLRPSAQDACDEDGARDEEDRTVVLFAPFTVRQDDDLGRLDPVVSHLAHDRLRESRVPVRSAQAVDLSANAADPSADDPRREQEDRCKKTESVLRDAQQVGWRDGARNEGTSYRLFMSDTWTRYTVEPSHANPCDFCSSRGWGIRAGFVRCEVCCRYRDDYARNGREWVRSSEDGS